VFESGQLNQLQSQLSAETDTTIRRLSSKSLRSEDGVTHPFSSPLLLNHLSSLSLSVHPFDPSTLVDPIRIRRHQLIQQAVPRLQLSAQRGFLGTYSVAATGIFASWAAYVEPLSLLSSETALGCGTLSVAASLVLGQSLWKRAERRFWKDFDRIVEMLQHDLQVGFWLTF
jgi:hypothetical protein